MGGADRGIQNTMKSHNTKKRVPRRGEKKNMPMLRKNPTAKWDKAKKNKEEPIG